MSEHSPARTPRPLAAGLTIAVTALLAVGAAAPASAAVVPDDAVVLTAEPSSVSVGDTVTVTVAATGLVDAYAYDLDVDVDPELLAFVPGSQTTPDGGFGSATADGGTVSVVATRLGTSPGLSGDQTLVTLAFTALAEGSADISLISATFVDSNGAATPFDTASDPLSAVVEITAVDDSGADAGGSAEGSGASDAGGSESGSASADADPETGAGSLATTGADAAPWLLAAGIAVILAAAGSVLVMRRRTR